MKKKILAKIVAFVLCVIMVAPVLAACNRDKAEYKFRKAGEHTYYASISATPTNWNPHTWEGDTGLAMLNYITTGFYSYTLDPEALAEYKAYVETNGSSDGFTKITMNKGQIIVCEGAMKYPEDVTSQYKTEFSLSGDANLAWRVYLNPDLKWQDGASIKAKDYEDSMKLLLSPKLMNLRADAYTESSRTPLVGAKEYMFQGKTGVNLYLDGKGYLNSAVVGETVYFNWDNPLTPIFAELFTGSLPANMMTWAGLAEDWGEVEYYIPRLASDVAEADKKYIIGEEYEIHTDKDCEVDDCENEAHLETFVDLDIYTKWADRIAASESEEGIAIGQVAANGAINYVIPSAELADLEADFADLVKMWAFEWYSTYLSKESLAVFEDAIEQGWVSEFLFGKAFEYGELDWEEVGYKTGSDAIGEYIDYIYSLPMTVEEFMLAEDGTYLVHVETYNNLMNEEGTVTRYNSTLAGTKSYGPYKMTVFQTGKEIIFERNTSFYGFDPELADVEAKVEQTTSNDYGKADIYAGMTYGEKFEGTYQTDRIYYQIVSSTEAASLLFDKGLLDRIGITAVNKDAYSGGVWLTSPTSQVSSYAINVDEGALRAIDTYGTKNAQVLVIPELREAISLSLNRAQVAQQFTVSSTHALYMLSMLQYIDIGISDAALYRTSEWGKKAIAELYQLKYVGDGTSVAGSGVFKDLDDAVAKATGFDDERAAELFGIAYDKAIEQGLINASDEVVINILVPTGTATFNATLQQRFDYECGTINEAARNAPTGHKFAKFEIKAQSILEWEALYNDAAAGKVAIFAANNSGAVTTLYNKLNALLTPGNNFFYNYGFVPKEIETELIGGGDTKTVGEWYAVLGAMTNAASKSEEDLEMMARIGATIELALMRSFTTLPTLQAQETFMYSKKINAATDIYNIFVGFGSLKEMTYNMDDAEWYKAVKNNNWKVSY